MSEFRRRLMAVKKEELKENEVLAIYNVTSTSSNTRMFGSAFDIANVEKMSVDGIEITPAKTYKFTTLGEHEIKVKINDTATSIKSIFEYVPIVSISNASLPNISNAISMFYGCTSIISVGLIRFGARANTSYMFDACSNLKDFGGIKNLNYGLNISNSPQLTALSVHNIIEQALGSFTLKLHATAKTNWQNSEYYTADKAMATEKNITIQ